MMPIRPMMRRALPVGAALASLAMLGVAPLPAGREAGARAHGAEPIVQYFAGDARLTFVAPIRGYSVPDSGYRILVKRVTDAEAGVITETATYPDMRTGEAVEGIITMRVTGSSVRITGAGTGEGLVGTGVLNGDITSWTELRMEMIDANGMRIRDENYEDSKHGRVVARKAIADPDGVTFMLWDGELAELDPDAFEAERKKMAGE